MLKEEPSDYISGLCYYLRYACFHSGCLSMAYINISLISKCMLK